MKSHSVRHSKSDRCDSYCLQKEVPEKSIFSLNSISKYLKIKKASGNIFPKPLKKFFQLYFFHGSL